MADGGSATRRRRECLRCGRRYTTFERVEDVHLVVVKRSGEPGAVRPGQDPRRDPPGGQEPPDHARTTSPRWPSAVEDQVREAGPRSGSEVVGKAVLDQLRALDPVAYLRFASVYKGFEDVTDFEREVGLLQKTTTPKGSRSPAS